MCPLLSWPITSTGRWTDLSFSSEFEITVKNCKIKLSAIIADFLNGESIYFATKHEQQQQYLYSPCTSIQTWKRPKKYIYIYKFTEVQVSRVIIVLLLQNCFVWCKDHTHQAILTTELLELEGWQLNAKISMVAMVDALNSSYMKVLKGLLGNNNII